MGIIIFMLFTVTQPEVIVGNDTISIQSLYNSLFPDSADYKFEAPKGWGKNLAPMADIVSSDNSSKEALKALIDNIPYTVWTSKPKILTPVVTLRFKKLQKFNRIVIFNRFTDMRGSGGGCNSAKKMELQVSPDDNAEDLECIDTLELSIPKAACFNTTDKHHICFIIPNKEGDVFKLPTLNVKMIQLHIIETCYSKIAKKLWGDSLTCAFSEVMLFYCR